MATNEDAWIRKNGLVLTLYGALAATAGVLAVVAVDITLTAAGREGVVYEGTVVVPWLVLALLGIPGAYRRGVVDERKCQALPDFGGESKQ